MPDGSQMGGGGVVAASPMGLRDEPEVSGAMFAVHRLETALLQQRIELLEAVLREHGIPSPAEDSSLGASGADHLEACRNVVRGAYELIPHLESLRAIVGSGMELLNPEPWRP
jgi:hypothetical protein